MNAVLPPDTRRFTAHDQKIFAAASGDYNPVHMDPVAARRTAAGACVVHGVHGLLWSLEQLADHLPLQHLTAISADFAQFLYLNEAVTPHLTKLTAQDARIELRAGEMRLAQYALKFGTRTHAAPPDPVTGPNYPVTARTALPLGWEAIAAAAGTVAYFDTSTSLAPRLTPRLTQAIGAERVVSILASTRLVGMVCPGLHSIFHRLAITLVEDTSPVDRLTYKAASSDARYAVVTLNIRATGVAGSLTASRRPPPTAQPSAAALRPLVAPGQFHGHQALVIGGSRGLGEVTAKLLALGGAHAVITYAQGQAEAETVIADIAAAGGSAAALKLDVNQPIAPQLAALTPPTSAYFFATPRISTRSAKSFSYSLFNDFSRFYIAAFHELCTVLAANRKTPVHILYPSSIFVAQPVKNMAEYAMAKAAGEVLCQDLTRFSPNLQIEAVRLPRLQTDQTATIIDQNTQSAAEIMLPIISSLEARVA